MARRLAQALQYGYVDSGALYRAVGWVVCQQRVPLDDSVAIVALLARTSIELTLCHGQAMVRVAGQHLTCHLSGERIGQAASAVALLPAVRRLITAQLRRLRCQADLVMEGRDIGTVVFPDATLKFFLEASLTTRSQRRFQEMRQSGQTLTSVQDAMATRDRQDQSRALAPLLRAPEARVIDTTDLTIDEVVNIMLSEVRTSISQRNV